MLKRIKRAYKALTTDEDVLPRLSFDISNLTPEQFESLSHGGVITIPREQIKEEVQGDGKAEFFPEMTEEEYQDYIREEENGWKAFTNKLGL